MLWFVGLGVSGPDSIPKEVGKIIQKADLVYLESFTSPITKSMKKVLKIWLMGISKLQKDGW